MRLNSRKKTATSDLVSTTNLPAPIQARDINIALLLDPEIPARDVLDEVKLQELTNSVAEFGILEPLLVHPDGEGYRVAAGHRRLIVARALNLQLVPCRIFPDGAVIAEVIKHHENRMREDLNPADQANYFARLLEEKCDADVDELCKLVGESRGYVEDRLLLYQGDPNVFQALKDGTIRLGVAKELNLVRDGARRAMYLDCAIKGGSTVSMVRGWRIKGNLEDEQYPANGPSIPIVEGDPGQRAQGTGMVCMLCDSSQDQHEMEVVFIHRSCRRREERIAEGQASGS